MRNSPYQIEPLIGVLGGMLIPQVSHDLLHLAMPPRNQDISRPAVPFQSAHDTANLRRLARRVDVQAEVVREWKDCLVRAAVFTSSADFRRQNVPDVVGGLCAKDIAQALCAFEPVRVEAVVGWVVGFFAVADEVYSWMVGCCGEDG